MASPPKNLFENSGNVEGDGSNLVPLGLKPRTSFALHGGTEVPPFQNNPSTGSFYAETPASRSTTPISVIAPARNAAAFYPGWLRSIEQQGYDAIEVLLVDDGSDPADGLYALTRGAPRFLRYLRLEGVGPAAARNYAIAESTGTYFAFLDLDDRWARGHLHRLAAVLDQDSDAGIAQGLIRKFLVDDAGQTFLCSEAYRFVNLGAALYRRSVFDVCGLFDADLRFGEDFDLIVRCWENGIGRVEVPEVSLFYQRHEANMTNGKSVIDLGAVRVYKRRLERMRAGRVDPALVQQRRVNFADYLGRTVGPFDEGLREAIEL